MHVARPCGVQNGVGGEVETNDLVYALVGAGALLAGLLPRLLERRPLSVPLVFLGLGLGVFALPTGLPGPDPQAHLPFVEHFTEICVVIALMGAGLKIDRPLGWRRWSSTWRLLAIAMPLTIAAMTLLGWWAGLGPAAALLLAAALAPTDPVLAADVQVGDPNEDSATDATADEAEDEVRFALTSEAGLNDGLAFPFVYAAMAMTVAGTAPGGWITDWLTVDVLYKVVAGVAGGLIIGRLLGRLFFRARSQTLRLAKHSEGFLVIAATALAYGITELFAGYGFLAVFVCARAIRSAERSHEYHQVLHDFAEQTERLLTVALLCLLGGAVVGGVLAPLTWAGALAGLALLFVVRPVSGWLALYRGPGRRGQRAVIAFFGIRGVGSVYYLAYATNHAGFPGADLLWAITGFVIVVSVVVHGITATPVMRLLDRAADNRAA
jgi:NhaP-type Na+/H+ or K+/H+ antiporter